MTTESPYQPLLDLATPNLYQRNPFRVLSLSPRTPTRDVQRAAKRMKIQIRTGLVPTIAEGESGAKTPESVTAEQIDAALERLTHPTARLLDELFWFWPTGDGTEEDPGIQAWLERDLEGARAHWTTQTQLADRSQLAFHNLALLDHLTALDIEGQRSVGTEPKSSRRDDLHARWQRALSQWHQAMKGDAFWVAIKERIVALADAQLTTGLVPRLRATFPLALALINARLAYAAAERGDAGAAKRQLKVLREAELGQSIAEDALAEVLKPLRGSVNSAVAQAKIRWTAAPQKGNQVVRDLYTQVAPLLAIADILLPEKDFSRSSLHDLVAQAIVDAEIPFSNKTNDWREGNALLSLAQSIAIGEPLRDKIAQSQKLNQDSIESGNDWCSPGYWDLPEATIEALEAARQKAMSGDFNGALDALIVMDASIGKPLKRCVAYTLNMKAVRLANSALSDYNLETEVILKASRSHIFLRGKLPDPNRRASQFGDLNRFEALSRSGSILYPGFLDDLTNPACPGCGSTEYTTWVVFTYKSRKRFLCTECDARHERELEHRKPPLRVKLEEALVQLLLASEIDPDDPGIKKNLKTLQDTSREYNAQTPTSNALKYRLASKTNLFKSVFVFISSMSPETDIKCHFCEQEGPDQSSAITVRMSGDVQKTTCLFGSRVQFSHIVVAVPRCRSCRDQHRQLVKHREDWSKGRALATADGQFPDQVAKLAAAREALNICEGRIGEARAAVAQFERSKMRKALTATYPLAALAALYGLLAQLPEPVFWGSVQIESLSGWNADESSLYLPIAIAGLVGPLLGWRLGTSLNRGWSRRRTEARTALAAAEAERTQAAAGVEGAEARLQAAKSEADAAYLSAHPQPELPSGVKPEDTYVESKPIKTREIQGWSIGMLQGTAESHQVVRGNSDIRGLVGEPA